ncbi:hypothetical protein HaLaN_30236 [Haematococcus lacustris]|uniref:Uncharacterized protein n=1 Tax=Haematococcus lacustris TaxID=44745 RepID=A0A6A0AF18_HAELA|nr:hypothetical protein HaLaN_30236 [Haematococcus lacustris]
MLSNSEVDRQYLLLAPGWDECTVGNRGNRVGKSKEGGTPWGEVKKMPCMPAWVPLLPGVTTYYAAQFSSYPGKRRVNRCIRVLAGASDRGHTSAAQHRLFEWRCWRAIAGHVMYRHRCKREKSASLSRQSHNKRPLSVLLTYQPILIYG